MAITETSTTKTDAQSLAPSTESAVSTGSTGSPVPAPRGLAGVLGSGDHKTIGRLYIGFSLLFGLAAFGLWVAFGLEAMKDLASQTDRGFWNFTLSQLSLILLFVIPLFVGLATAIVPLQVGASTVAFPRAAALAFWVWLISAVLLIVSYLPGVNGGVFGADANGQGLTQLALGGLIVSLVLASVCITTTVIALRVPGLGLDRVPLFSWSMLVAGGLWILTLPVLLANVALIFIDSKYGAPSKFAVGYSQWTQLAWITGPPQIFAAAIPALGIAADALSTLAGVRIPRRSVALFAIGAFGALSFGAYAQLAYNPEVYGQWPFIAQSVLIVLPVLLLLGASAPWMRRGARAGAGPVLCGFVALVLLLLASVASAVFAISPLGLQTNFKALTDTSRPVFEASAGVPVFAWGISGLVVPAAIAGAVAGLAFWSAKLAGRPLRNGWVSLVAVLLLVAALLLSVPLLVLGFAAKAEALVDNAKVLYGISLAGAAVAVVALALAFMLFFFARVGVARHGSSTDPDPWGSGQSLEWATDSPPANGNFGVLPVVRSPEPLLDAAEAARAASNTEPGTALATTGEAN